MAVAVNDKGEGIRNNRSAVAIEPVPRTAVQHTVVLRLRRRGNVVPGDIGRC